LVQASPVQGVSAKLRNLDKKENDLVVVRADVVAVSSDLPYNIVVPVDVESEAVLSRVVDEIKAISGVIDAVVLKVLEHHPKPPHDGYGYVTDQEVKAGKDKKVKPGRQGASPGANPFG
jgi:enoyl-[acyl-carrier-protein] reductase (NADH)